MYNINCLNVQILVVYTARKRYADTEQLRFVQGIQCGLLHSANRVLVFRKQVHREAAYIVETHGRTADDRHTFLGYLSVRQVRQVKGHAGIEMEGKSVTARQEQTNTRLVAECLFPKRICDSHFKVRKRHTEHLIAER